ncbi:MAG: hypothetical protein M5R40_05045 [Anaerolineae bacterium]|nr:hypothetical protein [Anaerolineae bacterium]
MRATLPRVAAGRWARQPSPGVVGRLSRQRADELPCVEQAVVVRVAVAGELQTESVRDHERERRHVRAGRDRKRHVLPAGGEVQRDGIGEGLAQRRRRQRRLGERRRRPLQPRLQARAAERAERGARGCRRVDGGMHPVAARRGLRRPQPQVQFIDRLPALDAPPARRSGGEARPQRERRQRAPRQRPPGRVGDWLSRRPGGVVVRSVQPVAGIAAGVVDFGIGKLEADPGAERLPGRRDPRAPGGVAGDTRNAGVEDQAAARGDVARVRLAPVVHEHGDHVGAGLPLHGVMVVFRGVGREARRPAPDKSAVDPQPVTAIGEDARLAALRGRERERLAELDERVARRWLQAGRPDVRDRSGEAVRRRHRLVRRRRPVCCDGRSAATGCRRPAHRPH